jgi:hypothetical protein
LDFIFLFFIHVTSEVGTNAVQSNEDVVNCKISIKIYYVFLQLSIVQTEKLILAFSIVALIMKTTKIVMIKS